MTVKSEISSLNLTPTARAAFQSKGTDGVVLLNALKQMAIEMQGLVSQVIRYHPQDSVVSATVATAGSGGTNGKATLVGTTGVGTKFVATGSVSGGALSGPITIVSGGSYSTDPTTLSSEPVSGGPTGAALALTMSNDNAVLASLNTILGELV